MLNNSVNRKEPRITCLAAAKEEEHWLWFNS